ncbi:MAG TPA: hypothetical protein VJG90_00525 [Candidatus Nanoarchaeia archaeon]|nr:hypothetical protein [Candidatus Nanoarchaeia archaeon]
MGWKFWERKKPIATTASTESSLPSDAYATIKAASEIRLGELKKKAGDEAYKNALDAQQKAREAAEENQRKEKEKRDARKKALFEELENKLQAFQTNKGNPLRAGTALHQALEVYPTIFTLTQGELNEEEDRKRTQALFDAIESYLTDTLEPILKLHTEFQVEIEELHQLLQEKKFPHIHFESPGIVRDNLSTIAFTNRKANRVSLDHFVQNRLNPLQEELKKLNEDVVKKELEIKTIEAQIKQLTGEKEMPISDVDAIEQEIKRNQAQLATAREELEHAKERIGLLKPVLEEIAQQANQEAVHVANNETFIAQFASRLWNAMIQRAIIETKLYDTSNPRGNPISQLERQAHALREGISQLRHSLSIQSITSAAHTFHQFIKELTTASGSIVAMEKIDLPAVKSRIESLFEELDLNHFLEGLDDTLLKLRTY